MDKEKQAFEAWNEDVRFTEHDQEMKFSDYIASDYIIDSSIGHHSRWIIGNAFYGGYHSRDEEIAALKAEIERKDEALRVVLDSAGKDWYPHDDDRAIVENALNHSEKPDSLWALKEVGDGIWKRRLYG